MPEAPSDIDYTVDIGRHETMFRAKTPKGEKFLGGVDLIMSSEEAHTNSPGPIRVFKIVLIANCWLPVGRILASDEVTLCRWKGQGCELGHTLWIAQSAIWLPRRTRFSCVICVRQT